MKRLITIVATTIALASLTGCVGGTIKPLYTDQITEGKTAEVQVKKIYSDKFGTKTAICDSCHN